MISPAVSRNALVLTVFAAAIAAGVSVTFLGTKARIAEQKRHQQEQVLSGLAPTEGLDLPLREAAFPVRDTRINPLGAPLQGFRAIRGGRTVGIILPAVTTAGYNGRIELLVGLDAAGTLVGVQVLEHQETPGLGDAIEARKSDWLRGFDARSLNNPPPAGWRVRKDGGVFDQLTGATITPRAVVAAVRAALEYFADHRDELLSPDPSEGP